MARNRKRAKERRARRPEAQLARSRASAAGIDEAPDPIEHATPDVELAEAQLAVGRPELPEDEDERAGLEADIEEDEALAEGGDGRGGGEIVLGSAGPGGAGVPARRVQPGNRLVGFLQGSWRELQRVQWPDRRQVVQATSVVIGFVIIAGAFLGLADLVASKLMSFVLK